MSWVIPAALVAVSGPGLIVLARRAGDPRVTANRLRYMTSALAAGLLLFGVAAVVGDGAPFDIPGDLSGTSDGLGWFGVADGEQWGRLLLSLGGGITLITGTVIWLQVGRPAHVRFRALPRVLPLAALLAALNATAEELIFRAALLTALDPAVADGLLSVGTVAVIGALVFGLPHYMGSPGGVPGVLMAGFLGWLACTSIVQTGGLLWAWVLHISLDIVIFTITLAAERNVTHAGAPATADAPMGGAHSAPPASGQ